MEKQCTKCGEVKKLTEYNRGKGINGHVSACKSCISSYNKAYNARSYADPKWRAKKLAHGKKYYNQNTEKVNKQSKEWRKSLKNEVYLAYGNQCQCCGETTREFLSLDHVNNDGAEHRRNIGGISKMQMWAKRNGFPDSLRLLCYNCNCGRQRNNGICPHEAEVKSYVRAA